MMTGTLTDILIVLAVAVVATLIFSRLRLPALVGLFVAGALIGPNSLALIGSAESVEALAEIGVIFLLFTLGLEFSFGRMRRLARVILIAGPLQVIVTGVCETDFSGYPDCRDDTMKAMQLALSLGMDKRFLIETPLMP